MFGDRDYRLDSSGSSINGCTQVARTPRSRRDTTFSRRRINGEIDLQPFEVSSDPTGYVVTLKEDFGFVKCVSSMPHAVRQDSARHRVLSYQCMFAS